jgi:hypothetical protein
VAESEPESTYTGQMNREDEDAIQRSIEVFEQLSGQGDSQGWKFNREAIHERQTRVSSLEATLRSL